LPKLLPLFKLGLGGRMGSGRQWWSWVSLDDEVRALRWLIDHEVHGPVNLVAPGAVTNADFARILGHVLHRPAAFPVPAFGPKLLRGPQLAHELLFASQRVQPSVLTTSGFMFSHRDLDSALRSVLNRPE
jgi:NAD dependent epimerase/dehydratase family enzyme